MNFADTETARKILSAIDQKGFYGAFVQGWHSSRWDEGDVHDAEYERRRIEFLRAVESLSIYIGYTHDLRVLRADIDEYEQNAELNRSTPYRDGSV